MMTKTKVRTPKQERSIETKNKIIAAGYKVFSTVGYYGTNTAEIAKVAGVSTGIVYGYFEDKRDILMCVLEIYLKDVTDPIFNIMSRAEAPIDYRLLVKNVTDEVIKIHKDNDRLHNTLHSLAATDEGVNARFIEIEKTLTENISKTLVALGAKAEFLPEKVHTAMNIIQSFAHEYVFDNHNYINYSEMYNIIITTLANIFE